MPRFFIIILRFIIFFFFIIIIFFFDIILTQVGPTALEVIAFVGLGVAAKVAPDVRDTLPMIAAARAAVVSFVMLRLLPTSGADIDTNADYGTMK